MALGLHPKAQAVVASTLAEGLQHVRIKNGCFIDSFSVFMAAFQANSALPSNGAISDKLLDYIDDYPLIEFVVESIRREISDSREYCNDPQIENLLDIPGYSDAAETAKRLVTSLETLPWRYTYTLPLFTTLLPVLPHDANQVPMGFNGRIGQADLLLSEDFSLKHDNPKIEQRAQGNGLISAMMIGNRTWDSDKYYYQVETDGFVGIYGGGSITANVERDFESFLGLGLATKLFTYLYRYENQDNRPDWVVHKKMDQKWEFDSRFKLDEDISGVLRHMTSFKFSNDYPEENRTPWLQITLLQANRVFQSESSGTLRLATKWFFDSFKGSDQTLSYVRMMTTLEILLGERADTSKASLGEILGNRLAYLIGKNHSERAEILSDFKKVYGLRSGILHHGKHRLRGAEREYVSRLRTYCERAIQEETRLLLA